MLDEKTVIDFKQLACYMYEINGLRSKDSLIIKNMFMNLYKEGLLIGETIDSKPEEIEEVIEICISMILEYEKKEKLKEIMNSLNIQETVIEIRKKILGN